MPNNVKTYLVILKTVYPKYDWNKLYNDFGLTGIQAIENTLKEMNK